MMYWATIFLVLGVFAAVFALSGIVAGAVLAAKILSFAFLVVFLTLLIAGLSGRQRPHLR